MADKSAHKERTRARILDEAARALRVDGTEGISVGALMKRAGLTHGGFYAHFTSRDDLVAHAVERMFRDSAALLDLTLPPGAGAQGLGALIDRYLSEEAYAAPDRHCPLPTLSGEVPRMPAPAQAKFEAGISVFRARIEQALQEAGRDNAPEDAVSILAELVGAMALARSISDGALGRQMLASTRASLKRRLGLS